MPRLLSYESGKVEMAVAVERFKNKMRTPLAVGVVRNILRATVSGADGVDAADSLITLFELNRPNNGSHKFFGCNMKVVSIDENFCVPAHWTQMVGVAKSPREKYRKFPKHLIKKASRKFTK